MASEDNGGAMTRHKHRSMVAFVSWHRQNRVAVERGVLAVVKAKVRSQHTYADMNGGAIVLDIGAIVKALARKFA